ncbi:MAG: zinc ribbon domain-containing protein [Acidimicrobiales bacterium]|nr:zinc ribbon domain-containing protein [Acidimicrobiales bacterium]
MLVECRHCERANRKGALFCAGCGTGLAQRCHQCGAAVGEDHRYCDVCGEPIPKPVRCGPSELPPGRRPGAMAALPPARALMALSPGRAQVALSPGRALMALSPAVSQPVVVAPSGPTPADPRVLHWLQQLDRAVCQRDWETYRTLLSDHFVHRDHRLGQVGSTTPDEAVVAERQTAALFGAMQPSQVVSVGPGRIAIRSGAYGSSRVMPFVNLVLFDETGLVLRSETFDSQQSYRAFALASLWDRTLAQGNECSVGSA